MTIQIFGHKSPDTDTTGSAILWSWYLNSIKGKNTKPVLLGEPNTEANFMLSHWNLKKPEIISDVADNAPVIIVDTNNPKELPDNINNANIQAIIDHHKLVGGLMTKEPISITIRPLACTATILIDLMGTDAVHMPDWAKATALTCILSDTLEFRSPTTTNYDKEVAERLANTLGMNIPDYASELFVAKSDVSAFSDEELLRMDSKIFEFNGRKFRVSVLETTSPHVILDRKRTLIEAMETVSNEDRIDQVLFFIVDILNQQAILLIPNSIIKSVAEKSFNVTIKTDSIVLPGIVSRKKQIIPNLTI
ncbi:MAG: manganese-dependent inorganic pyrophosphatase [Aestuariivita sp.]|nr:manganese-dependent inorganic pyrophosphatase [Aestuariivita sp.]